MITKFEITNFKSFENTVVFDLSNSSGYSFHKEAIKNNIIKTAIVYGHNGVGKSNLGFAMFDIVSHLTDKNNGENLYSHYINANSNDNFVKFRYEFSFENGKVIYTYTKENLETLISEELIINDTLYASIDRNTSSEITINANGAENLLRDIGKSKISILSYIIRNTILYDDKNNRCFMELFDFVEKMLFFRSLEHNNYIGLEQGSNDIGEDIVNQGHIEEFEEFLNQAEVKCKLDKIELGDSADLAFKFDNRLIPFYSIVSQGTKALALFYYWYQRLKLEDNVSFVFIDEFDAFYHHELSAFIVEKLKELDIQVILTTHNTTIISNDILRPDCYFIMDDKKITSLASRTYKELREAHNIEKMYRAGSFE